MWIDTRRDESEGGRRGAEREGEFLLLGCTSKLHRLQGRGNRSSVRGVTCVCCLYVRDARLSGPLYNHNVYLDRSCNTS